MGRMNYLITVTWLDGEVERFRSLDSYVDAGQFIGVYRHPAAECPVSRATRLPNCHYCDGDVRISYSGMRKVEIRTEGAHANRQPDSR